MYGKYKTGKSQAVHTPFGCAAYEHQNKDRNKLANLETRRVYAGYSYRRRMREPRHDLNLAVASKYAGLF